MPENTKIPSSSTLDAPAGCYGGEIARAWQQVAYRSVAHRLTDVFTACAQAAELISAATTADAPAGASATGSLLDHISKAEQALDMAHDLAFHASDPNEAYCAICGEPIGILASFGTDWEHWEQESDPANGRVRNKVREMGHLPVPAWRPRTRPAIVAGRIVPREP